MPRATRAAVIRPMRRASHVRPPELRRDYGDRRPTSVYVQTRNCAEKPGQPRPAMSRSWEWVVRGGTILRLSRHPAPNNRLQATANSLVSLLGDVGESPSLSPWT